MTGACAEIVYLNEPVEPDYDGPIGNDDLVAALEERTRPLAPEERLEIDLVGDDEFGI